MNPADPWRIPVVVAQIPDTGLHRAFEAGEVSRAAMAEIAGVREVITANASFDLQLKSGGRVHVAGEVHARIGQTCVVTLEPIENQIDEVVDLVFAPPEQIRSLAALVDEAAQSEDEQVPDPAEPIVDGVIDLGRLATDVLFLAIDPYPRRSGAVFEPPREVVDPADHPFAALKKLQTSGSSGPDKKDPS
jgi:uncharacterized metal-binding protein YceD (DUF177 family)